MSIKYTILYSLKVARTAISQRTNEKNLNLQKNCPALSLFVVWFHPVQKKHLTDVHCTHVGFAFVGGVRVLSGGGAKLSPKEG